MKGIMGSFLKSVVKQTVSNTVNNIEDAVQETVQEKIDTVSDNISNQVSQRINNSIEKGVDAVTNKAEEALKQKIAEKLPESSRYFFTNMQDYPADYLVEFEKTTKLVENRPEEERKIFFEKAIKLSLEELKVVNANLEQNPNYQLQ